MIKSPAVLPERLRRINTVTINTFIDSPDSPIKFFSIDKITHHSSQSEGPDEGRGAADGPTPWEV